MWKMIGWPELSVEWYREQYAHNPISIGVWAAKLWEHYIDLETKLEAMERDRDELWCRALTIEDPAVINRITRRFLELRAVQRERKDE